MTKWIDNSSAELRRLYLCLEEEIKKSKEQERMLDDRKRISEIGKQDNTR